MITFLTVIHVGFTVCGLELFALACLQDWALRLVSNRVPAGITIVAIFLRLADGTLVLAIPAAVSVLIAAVCLWKQGWLGGADVKLFAAGALLVPPAAVTSFILVSCIAGGLLAVLYACIGYIVRPPSSQRPTNRLRRYLRLEQRRLVRRGPLPYATAISIGAYFVLLGG